LSPANGSEGKVIRYKVDERLDEVMDRTGRRPSFTEIEKATGVSVSVLSSMRTKAGYVTTTRVIDALCRFFQCQPGDLMVWRPDPVEVGDAGSRQTEMGN
jgi:putative transcriptional regulator